MSQIIPIKHLKNTSEISDLCHKSQEPIFITKNGYGDMVIMSMETYEETFQKLQMYKDLEISEEQIDTEKTKDARTSLADIRRKHGL